MSNVVLTALGLYTPPEAISNDELVASFNAYDYQFNAASARACCVRVAGQRLRFIFYISQEFTHG